MAQAFVGTSGFTLQNFYSPDVASSKRLSIYAQQFSSVEINSCFYHLPTQKTLTHWHESVGQSFTFSFKVWKEVTHSSQHQFDFNALESWFTQFQSFAAQGHVMLFQLPASFQREEKKLRQLCQYLPKSYRYAFELRHPSWFAQDVYSILRQFHVSLVVSDSPVLANGQRLWPFTDQRLVDFSYFRFHGTPRLYASSYQDKELKSYAQNIRNKVLNGDDVFCYFNNDAQGHAAENARTMQSLLS
jgi:uncharacterized protein YecE (DUF72 family)